MNHTSDFIEIINHQTVDITISQVRENLSSSLLFIINDFHINTIEELHDFAAEIGSIVAFGDLSGQLSQTQIVRKKETEKKSYGGWYYLNTDGFGDWHYDGVASQNAYSHTCLFGRHLPAKNQGDTVFAFTNLALEDLSDLYKNLLLDLRILHVQRPIKNWPQEWFERMIGYHSLEHVFKKTSRPLISTWHGLHGIYVSPSRAWKIENMHEEESQTIINFLSHHILKNEYCYRHVWQPNQLLIWNNWLSLHYPVNDYDCNKRELWRVCIDSR